MVDVPCRENVSQADTVWIRQDVSQADTVWIRQDGEFVKIVQKRHTAFCVQRQVHYDERILKLQYT